MKRTLDMPEAQRTTNDAKTFKKNLLFAVAPKSLPPDAPENEQKEFKQRQSRMIKRLGLKRSGKRMFLARGSLIESQSPTILIGPT